jgi:membrane protease YdiL (CAAX protease family)
MSPADLGWCRPRLGALGAAGWSALAVAVLLVALFGVVNLVEPQRETTLGFGFSVTLVAFCIFNGFMAPLIEELAFRGYLYAGLRTVMPMALAAVIVGVLFGTAHFASDYPVEAVVLLALLGASYCVLRDVTGSIVPGLALHGVQNAVVLVALTGQPGISLAMGGAVLLVCALAWLSPGPPAAAPDPAASPT